MSTKDGFLWRLTVEKMINRPEFSRQQHDAVILATAASNDLDAIITENVRDFYMFKKEYKEDLERTLKQYEKSGKSDGDKERIRKMLNQLKAVEIVKIEADSSEFVRPSLVKVLSRWLLESLKWRKSA